MAEVGRLKAIWRYPVKSMLGESLSDCEVRENGVSGDRGFALRDESAGEMRGAKKFPVLMQCHARYREEPFGEAIPPVDIEFPDGTHVSSTEDRVHRALSELVGKNVTLWPRQPASNRDHYRRAGPLTEPALREAFGRLPEEPLPDLRVIPPDLLSEISEFTSPLGTYFDAYPIHLLTTSWLDHLATHNPDSRFGVERFRPNFLIEGAESGLAEAAWCGKRLRIGDAIFACEIPTMRCSMTVQQTGPLPKDAKVLRTIVQKSDQNVGAYAAVESPGRARVGDAVELL